MATLGAQNISSAQCGLRRRVSSCGPIRQREVRALGLEMPTQTGIYTHGRRRDAARRCWHRHWNATSGRALARGRAGSGRSWGPLASVLARAGPGTGQRAAGTVSPRPRGRCHCWWPRDWPTVRGQAAVHLSAHREHPPGGTCSPRWAYRTGLRSPPRCITRSSVVFAAGVGGCLRAVWAWGCAPAGGVAGVCTGLPAFWAAEPVGRS